MRRYQEILSARPRRGRRCDELHAAGLHRSDRRRVLRCLRHGPGRDHGPTVTPPPHPAPTAAPCPPSPELARDHLGWHRRAPRHRPNAHQRAGTAGRRLGRDPTRALSRPGRRRCSGRPPSCPKAGGSAPAATSRSAAAATAQPGRTEGFCRKCGTPFSFAPKLGAGDAGRRAVRGGRVPRPRRHGLDLPGPRPQRVRPVGGAEGPAQLRRRRRDGRRARRAPLPGRGRAPEHRARSSTSSSTRARATSSWSTSAGAA